MSVETFNKTQNFLNEVFPEYKDSESHILERIKTLEKRDQDNQKMLEMMMSICENTVTQLNNKIDEQANTIKNLEEKSVVCLDMIKSITHGIARSDVETQHHGPLRSFSFIKESIYNLWKIDRDTIVKIYSCDNFDKIDINLLKLLFIDCSSIKDLKYFINRAGEIYFEDTYLKYGYKTDVTVNWLKLWALSRFQQKFMSAEEKSVSGRNDERQICLEVIKNKNIFLRKFKQIFDSIELKSEKSPYNDKFYLLSPESGENRNFIAEMNNIIIKDEDIEEFKIDTKVYYKKRKMYGRIIEIDELTNSYTIKLDNDIIIDTIKDNIETY